MRNSPPKYFCALLFCLLISAIAYGQLSKKHYIPPLTFASQGNANPQDQYIYISTPNNLNVAFTIIPLGQPANAIMNGTVSSNNSQEIFIGNGVGQLFQHSSETSKVVNDHGYIIEAEDVIYVSIRMRAGNSAQAGALVSKGNAGLGTVFRAGSYTNENPQTNYLNFFSFMATENNTTVLIDDLPAGIAIRNYTGTFPITVNLNEGESYVVATNSFDNVVNRDGLIGTLIESDKPIVVNSGSTNGSFHNGNGRDYGIDQIVGENSIGNEYIFVRGDGANSFENILIVAHEDNTDVFINDNTSASATINAGEYYLIEGDEYNANGNMYVTASKDVFAYQGVGGNGNNEPNQGMFFVPPLSCNNRGDLNSIASIQNIGNRVYNGGITIVTNKNSTVEIDGQPIANFTPDGPFDVDGNPDYVTYKVLGLTDDVSVVSTGELYCAYFNFNGVATSGSFYSGFPSPPEIDFNLDVTAAGNCIPNITLEAFNTDVFDSIEWYYDDGNGFVTTGDTTNSFKPLEPGGYKLRGTIVCSGLTFDSPEVRVSICPDDFDGDLIIDNVDIDIDNDGVLNCDESLGDVIIDLSNNQEPVLNFQDGSTNSTFIDAEFLRETSSGNTTELSSENNGDFTSTLGSAISARIEYRMNFEEDVNFLFREKSGYIHSPVNGEVFTIIIGPSEQNITLLDPDNQILVDTDFDGIFEAGVNNFSTSEIRFRYNPTPNGPRPYRFVASKIDYAIFRHQLSNTAQESSFQGHFGLTCFSLDSDGDGNEDAHDLDNDNDGIPDLLEASGRIIALTNSDANSDGLDDVFNNIGLTPADTDNDGIPDFLDLDSDNDGIFDLFEAGHGSADTDLNGVIDNSDNNSGSNGLFDAIETSADSFILNFIIGNSDNDNFINATELDSDNDLCFDVLEAGFTDPDNDGLLHTSPIQVNQFGIVQNAPDGYTLPNSNYTVFAPIVINTPFEDVAFCESSDAIISIDTSADIFQWQVSTNGSDWTDLNDTGTYSGSNSNTLRINPLPLTFNNYQFRVLLERTGNSCSEISNEINLTVEPLPNLNSNIQLTVCDDDTDGIATFDLTDALPLLSTNYLNEVVNYYTSESDAIAATNSISDPITFTNTIATNQTIWVSVTSNFGCTTFSTFELHVSTTQLPSSFSRSFTSCDDFLDINGNDTSNNNDRDGISSFDFSSVTNDILALFPSNQSITIRYYPTEIDAQNQQNEIINIDNYRNSNSPNNQFIFIRIDDTINASCNSIGPYIELIVESVPEINSQSPVELCDDDSDGIVSGFDLESYNDAILGTQNPTNFVISYHITESDARDDINAISELQNFSNTIPFQQSIYVRVENNSTGCFSTGFAFDLIVLPKPVIGSLSTIELCDDSSDGSATNGLLQNIDLNAQINQILGNLNSVDYQVSFYNNEQDAQSASNAIVSPYTNSNPFQETIFVRLENTLTSCFSIDSFELLINPEPEIQNIPSKEFCDDDQDGIVSNIVLTDYISEILGSLNPNEYQVSFHESNLDAINGANSLTSPYTNSIPYEQEIFVRVQNIATGCVNTNSSFMIVIMPQPMVISPPNLELCDDDDDGIISGFNLNDQTSIILGNLDPSTHSVSYYLSENDANLGINPIDELTNFTNTIPYLQTIFVRVDETNNICSNTSITFDLIVNPIPSLNIPNDLVLCDTNSDGFIQDIDLDSLTSQILGGQDPSAFSVSYHLSQSDADSGIDPISSPFTNSIAFTQTIFIRVQDLNTFCYSATGTFEIIVHPAPMINPVEDMQLCDNDDDGDDNNGFLQNIDLEVQIASILGDDQSEQDYSVSFYESLDDATQGINMISSPYANTIQNSQAIYVRVENIETGCSSVARSFTVHINTIPQFEVTSPQFICSGQETLDLGPENPIGVYDYFWIDPNGNELSGETITISQGGTYSITAINIDGTGCSKTKDIIVNQSSIPILTEEHVIINDGDQNSSIQINNNPGVLGIGDYEFALLDSDGNFVYNYQDEAFFGNLRGGIYIILVRDKNGCGRAELEVAVLEIPKFFTPNNDGVNDIWNLKGITNEFKDYFPSSKISVFDRYGKFIANFSIDEPGWNGRYNGQVLISNDYWYAIQLTDRNGRMREVKGNMSLLRRE